MAGKRPNVEQADQFAAFVRDLVSGVNEWLPVSTQKQLDKALQSLVALGSLKLTEVPKAFEAAKQAKHVAKSSAGSGAERLSEQERQVFQSKRESFESNIRSLIDDFYLNRSDTSARACLAQIDAWSGLEWPSPQQAFASEYTSIRNKGALASAAHRFGINVHELREFQLHGVLESARTRTGKLRVPEIKDVLLLLGEPEQATKGTKATLLKRLATSTGSYIERTGTYGGVRQLGA